MAIVGLGVKCGDTVAIEVEGADGDAACKESRLFLRAICNSKKEAEMTEKERMLSGKLYNPYLVHDNTWEKNRELAKYQEDRKCL